MWRAVDGERSPGGFRTEKSRKKTFGVPSEEDSKRGIK